MAVPSRALAACAAPGQGQGGSATASVYKQTTNHTLFCKLNRAVQRGQLEMHS